MCYAHSLYMLKGREIQLPDLLLACKWIHLVDPILTLPCTHSAIRASRPTLFPCRKRITSSSTRPGCPSSRRRPCTSASSSSPTSPSTWKAGLFDLGRGTSVAHNYVIGASFFKHKLCSLSLLRLKLHSLALIF